MVGPPSFQLLTGIRRPAGIGARKPHVFDPLCLMPHAPTRHSPLSISSLFAYRATLNRRLLDSELESHGAALAINSAGAGRSGALTIVGCCRTTRGDHSTGLRLLSTSVSFRRGRATYRSAAGVSLASLPKCPLNGHTRHGCHGGVFRVRGTGSARFRPPLRESRDLGVSSPSETRPTERYRSYVRAVRETRLSG